MSKAKRRKLSRKIVTEEHGNSKVEANKKMKCKPSSNGERSTINDEGNKQQKSKTTTKPTAKKTGNKNKQNSGQGSSGTQKQGKLSNNKKEIKQKLNNNKTSKLQPKLKPGAKQPRNVPEKLVNNTTKIETKQTKQNKNKRADLTVPKLVNKTKKNKTSLKEKTTESAGHIAPKELLEKELSEPPRKPKTRKKKKKEKDPPSEFIMRCFKLSIDGDQVPSGNIDDQKLSDDSFKESNTQEITAHKTKKESKESDLSIEERAGKSRNLDIETSFSEENSELFLFNGNI